MGKIEHVEQLPVTHVNELVLLAILLLLLPLFIQISYVANPIPAMLKVMVVETMYDFGEMVNAG